MTRTTPLLAALALSAGCILQPVAPGPGYAYPPPPPPPAADPYAYAPPPAPYAAPAVYSYLGQHFIPEALGGGWCYIAGPHAHDYPPDRPDWYAQENGYLLYQGPFAFAYAGPHPVPGGGWCSIGVLHYHDFYPPQGAGFAWQRGLGYAYRGPYSAWNPAPRTFWARELPPPPRAAIFERRGEYRYDRPLPAERIQAFRPAPAAARPAPAGPPGRPSPFEPGVAVQDRERARALEAERQRELERTRGRPPAATAPPLRAEDRRPANAPAIAPPPARGEPRAPAERKGEPEHKPAPEKARPPDRGGDRGDAPQRP